MSVRASIWSCFLRFREPQGAGRELPPISTAQSSSAFLSWPVLKVALQLLQVADVTGQEAGGQGIEGWARTCQGASEDLRSGRPGRLRLVREGPAGSLGLPRTPDKWEN